MSDQEIQLIRRRLDMADGYGMGVVDLRHDGTPVYSQLGDPVRDLRVIITAYDELVEQLREAQTALREETERAATFRFQMFEANQKLAEAQATIAQLREDLKRSTGRWTAMDHELRDLRGQLEQAEAALKVKP